MSPVLASLYFLISPIFSQTEMEPVVTNPCQLPHLTVTYENQNVNCDENKPLSTFLNQPKVAFPDAIQGKNYTLVMSDPDTAKQTVLHWIVANIDGQQLQSGEFGSAAKILAAYRKPQPPKGSGVHRYQFLLAEQNPGINVTAHPSVLPPDGERGYFQVQKFLEDNQLCNNLVAGFQFRSQFPE